MNPNVIDTVAAKLKAVEAKALPNGIFSTKFLAIGAALIVGVILLKGNVPAVLELVKWGVWLYVVQRLIEGGLHLVCDTAVKITAMLCASKHPAEPTAGN